MRTFSEPDLGVPDLRTPLRYFAWLVTGYRVPVVLAICYGVLCTLAQALVPAAIGRGIDEGLLSKSRSGLLLWSGVILGLGVTQALSGMLRDRCSLTNRLGASYRTMQLVTRQAAELGAELPRRVAAGSVVSISATDITRIGAAWESTARGGGAVVSIFVVAAIMLLTSWQLGLLALAGVPLIAWGIARIMRLLHGRQGRLREEQGALADLAVDIVEGLRVLRGIGGEEVFGRRYRERSQRVRREGAHVAGVRADIAAARLLLPGLLTTAIVWLGARLVSTGRISPGELIAFYGYAVFLAEQISRATITLDQLTRAVVAARQVTGFLALTPELAMRQLEKPEPSGKTAARAVATSAQSAEPPGHGELHDPESGLRLTAGRFTAVACHRISDARTLADRLGGYTRSSVTWEGQLLNHLPLDEVRRRIMVVDHTWRLFSGELRAELLPAEPGADAFTRLDRALEVASARDIVDALPEGFGQMITGSREFSGGQQQRLNLARALAADPDTLILVDPTSALDAHTEGRVAERLTAHRASRSTVLFTTSPVLLGHADHIAYVEGGRVVAEGSHSELLADTRYRSAVSREVTPA
ncbi:ABC transporter transmembrane domain-containing protein [Streptomyces uncialis]|uniref:ABC transporter transmembrane domain-containing protein n=1 Tax=Streptomyces uncialis TaxID=1048205 RepID=UPI00365C405F